MNGMPHSSRFTISKSGKNHAHTNPSTGIQAGNAFSIHLIALPMNNLKTISNLPAIRDLLGVTGTVIVFHVIKEIL